MQRLLRFGNDWADTKAKEGAALHARMREAMTGLFRRQWEDALSACRVIGEATTLWPAAAQLKNEQERRPTTRALRRAAYARSRQRAATRQATRRAAQQIRLDTHSWATVGAGVAARCVDCLAWKGADVGVCMSPASAWRACHDVAAAKGHLLQKGLLHEAGRGRPIQLMTCTHCGAYSTGAKMVGLAEQCNHASAAGAAAIARIASGRHPKAGRHPRWCSMLCSQIA